MSAPAGYAWSLHVENTAPLSISEESSDSFNLELYPNPAGDIMNLKMNVLDDPDVLFSIYDSVGKLIIEQNINNLTLGENSFTLNLANIAKGAYVICLTSQNEKISESFIKN